MLVVKVPGVNSRGKTLGCERSGNEILRILKKEIFSNSSGKDLDFSRLDLEEIHLDNSDLEVTNKLIYKNSFDSYSENPRVVFLGGDHSISYSLTRAFFDYCQNSEFVKEPCLIVFDAHPDLMPPQKEGQRFPTHEGWLRKLIEDGFPIKNVLLVGVRNSWKDERDFIRDKKIKVISVDSLSLDLEKVTDSIMEFSRGKELYVSFDIDVVDPSFAPSTGRCEPGGISSMEAIYLSRRISKMKNLKAFDLVEINSENDEKFGGMTVKLGARILGELL